MLVSDITSVDGLSSYYQWLRTDILRHVPRTAQHVLSVGCGAGATEAELVSRGVDVVGVEINHKAAAVARARGLSVIEGDAQAVSSDLAGPSFDCLIYADVLEHLADPLSVLRDHCAHLKLGGVVIISVPNFRHYRVFNELFVRGLVRYQEAGILDRTHLRITTRRMVLEWLEQVGVQPTECEYLMSQRRERIIAALSLGLLKDFVARQVIITGRKLESSAATHVSTGDVK